MAKTKRVEKTGYTKAELMFTSCRQWIGFSLAALMLVVFILLYSSYDNIDTLKLGACNAFCVTALALFVLASIQALLNGVRPRATSVKEIWKSISLSQKLIALYFLICCISYFASPYFGAEDLWKGTSRNDGLRSQMMYAILFFITANGVQKHKDWLLLGFAGTMLLFSLIGMVQMYGIEFWNFSCNSEVGPAIGFYTTVGNRNIVSAVLCMGIAVLTTAYTVWENKWRKWLAIPFVVSMLFMIMIQNDSGVVGVGAFLLVLPILCWNTAQRVSRGLFVFALTALSFAFSRIFPCVNGVGSAPTFALSTMGLAALGGAAVLAVLSWVIGKKAEKITLSKKTWTILWAALIVAFVIIAVVVFMSIELQPDDGFLYQFQEILRGNLDDSFGSGRIYVWKRALTLIPNTPLFGFGPDCFYVAFNEVNYYESMHQMNVFFDFAHNDYIQIAINYGLLGLGVYLAAMVCIAVRAVKRKEKNAFVIIFAMAAFTYCVQAFFSFSHIIMTPVFWTILGLTEASIKSTDLGLLQE